MVLVNEVITPNQSVGVGLQGRFHVPAGGALPPVSAASVLRRINFMFCFLLTFVRTRQVCAMQIYEPTLGGGGKVNPGTEAASQGVQSRPVVSLTFPSPPYNGGSLSSRCGTRLRPGCLNIKRLNS
jgi:hypothetical protein